MTEKPQQPQQQSLALFNALSAFQQECPKILKDTAGFGYNYADLPAIFAVINPLLKKHNLGFTQLVNVDTIDTILFSTISGETLVSKTALVDGVQLAKMNDFQVLGSQITYIRRYALSSMLGIITDKDTDAAGTQVRTTKTPASPVKPMTADIKDTMLGFIADGKKHLVEGKLPLYKKSALKTEVEKALKEAK